MIYNLIIDDVYIIQFKKVILEKIINLLQVKSRRELFSAHNIKNRTQLVNSWMSQYYFNKKVLKIPNINNNGRLTETQQQLRDNSISELSNVLSNSDILNIIVKLIFIHNNDINYIVKQLLNIGIPEISITFKQDLI